MKFTSWTTHVVLIASLAALTIACFGDALFRGGQFAYRDAAHYYYPLYKRVQTEWDAGRWPLWEPEENAGMPLLGNPTAAVLYPGKLIYTFLPYEWGARIYVVAHVILAWGAMLALMRGWGVSWVGSGIAGFTYAFGAPILFQYCNVIYLVGAAWLPLGFLALDRWLRLGDRRGLPGLAVVLAMQTLGGDPQVSYLLGLCGGGYALGLHRARRRQAIVSAGEQSETTRSHRWWAAFAGVLGLAVWVSGTLLLARLSPTWRPKGKPIPALPWMLWVPMVVLTLWGAVGLGFIYKGRKLGWRGPLSMMLSGLVLAAALSGALAAAQLLPVWEFTQQTPRAAGEGPHDIYPFSLEPFRLAEFVWPSLFGTQFGRNAYWVDAAGIPVDRAKIWVPSLYVGGFGVLLAAGAFTLRRGPAWRVWLSAIVLLSLLGSLGEFTSPIWAARFLEKATGIVTPGVGPLDPRDTTAIRQDGFLRDGDGGAYWWMSTLLPGFRQFRFPSKLLTFTVFGLASLAGLGWDGLLASRKRGLTVLAAFFLTTSLALLTAALIERDPIQKAWAARATPTSFGPLDVPGAYAELIRGLAHGTIVLAFALIIMALARSRPKLAGQAALAIIAFDLGAANARYVATVPQAMLEREPEVLRLIAEAEGKDPAPGPYRVHRMALWSPPIWYGQSSADRIRDFVAWEFDTIQPKHAINLGVEYTHTIGVAELYDYEWFFGGFMRTLNADIARTLGAQPGQQAVYYPRRSFDLWGTRYFVLPSFPNGWKDEFRGYAAFLHETEPIYPENRIFRLEKNDPELKAWVETRDFQIRRNRQEFPRAWVVHDARGLAAIEGLSRANRTGPMQEILYAGDPIWNDPTMRVRDPRKLAWVDNADLPALRTYLSGMPPRSAETAKVSYPSPQRVEVEANLDSPGIVILADVYYPGWKLTIDGKPAPVYRVNRLMRGAAVEKGTHKLVYRFEPRSFQVGLLITIAGLAGLVAMTAFFCLRPWSPTLQPEPVPDRPIELGVE